MTAVFVAGLACDSNNPPKASSAEPVQPPASSATNNAKGDVAEAASDVIDDETFNVRIVPAQQFEAGEEGFVQVVLEPKAPYKCNAEYPYKFKLDSAEGVKLSTDLVKRDAMSVSDEQTQFKVAITPSAGEHRVSGTFSFSVCTEENCLIERRKLALGVKAK